MLFTLTPKQRSSALQLAIKNPVSPAMSRVKGGNEAARDSPSTDSTCTEESTTGSENGSDNSSTGKRLHSKNRINRLSHKMCRQHLNAPRMWDHHPCGSNGRIIEHRLDSVLHQVNAKLSYREQKTFKTQVFHLMCRRHFFGEGSNDCLRGGDVQDIIDDNREEGDTTIITAEVHAWIGQRLTVV